MKCNTPLGQFLSYSLGVSTFAQWLEAQLAARGWSPAQLSRRSGIKQPSLSAYLNQGTIPSIESQVKLALALGVPSEEVQRAAHSSELPSLDMAEEAVRYAILPSGEMDHAESIVLALRNDPAKLKLWLEMGEALAEVVGQ
jgi:transcriptional regulator with XRE-family HTH domain